MLFNCLVYQNQLRQINVKQLPLRVKSQVMQTILYLDHKSK